MPLPKSEAAAISGEFGKCMEMLPNFMMFQEHRREEERLEDRERLERIEQQRLEEKDRYDRERKEDKERYERERKEEKDRLERIERQHEQDRREEKERIERLEHTREAELKKLGEAIKLKDTGIPKLVPTDDIENFLTTFERTASTYEWPKEKWVVKLAPKLTGKAQAAYAAMSSTDMNNYDKVKEAILKRYDITEETYRQRFRSLRKSREESYREMYVRLEDLFKKWTKPDGKTVSEIIEVIIMEQMVVMMPPGVQI